MATPFHLFTHHTQHTIMKKLCLTVAALSCFLAACDNMKKTENTADNDAAKRNIEACDAVNDAFKTGDVSKIDNYVAADMVDHTDHGDVKGVDSLKAMIQMM